MNVPVSSRRRPVTFTDSSFRRSRSARCVTMPASPWRWGLLHGLAVCGWMLAISGTVQAAPDPMPFSTLRTVFPPGASSGSEALISVDGQNLEDVTGLHFSHAGISAEPAEGGFKVRVAAEVPAGLYEVRVRGRFGLSNPRPFEVSAWQEILEEGSNQSMAQAQLLARGQVVNGRANARSYDHYRFSAEAGQRLFLECRAAELDSEMDPVLVLYDADGRELARSRHGGFLDFQADRTGDYRVQVYDFLYRGGSEYVYRLVLHEGPHVDYVLPVSALPGESATFTVFGRQLPGGETVPELSVDGQPLQKLSVPIDVPSAADFHAPVGTLALGDPVDAGTDWMEWRWQSDHGVGNPVRIYRALAPVTVESEANDEPAQAQKIAPPCEISGQFYPSRDRDWFEFESARDETWWVEVFSDRLGQPTDPFVLLQRVVINDQGVEKVSDVRELYDTDTKLGEREYDMDTRDAAWKFEVKEPGIYRILVQDLFHYAEPDPSHLYRLSVRRAQPDFRLVTVPESPSPENNDDRKARPWHVFLRRGETWPLKVLALRQDDFVGEIQLEVAGLPDQIRAHAASIPENHDQGYIYLTAAEEGADWAGTVMVKGRAKIRDQEVEHASRYATVIHHVNDFNNEFIASRLCSEMTVSGSVLEPSYVRVGLPQGDKVEAAVDAEVEIPVDLIRQDGFDQNVKFRLVGHDALGKVKEWEVDGKATNATWKINLKEAQVPAGVYRVALQGVTKGKYRNQPEAAAAAEEASQKAETAAKESGELAQKAAQELELAHQALQQAEAAAQEASAKLQEILKSLESSPQDDALIASKAQAEQSAADAQATAKAAQEKRAAADMARADADARKEAAEKAKKEAADQAKAAQERAKPRDVLLSVYSQPFTLEVVTPPPPEEETKKVAQNTQ